jgi:glucose-1-phosphate cytidylyltransferase
MKVIILAGGLGTRISEETSDKPKPMVRLNGKPILWHVMNIYAKQGFTDFVVACGYKKEVIYEYFNNEFIDPWEVEALDTGEETLTGGRISIILDKYPNERMGITYGDGLGNINIRNLISFHAKQETLATLTVARPPARFGSVEFANGLVSHFGEKNQADSGWINGGFFIVEPGVREYIYQLSEAFEANVLPRLVEKKELSAFAHNDFWQPMDTLREKTELEELAKEDLPPWLKFNSN